MRAPEVAAQNDLEKIREARKNLKSDLKQTHQSQKQKSKSVTPHTKQAQKTIHPKLCFPEVNTRETLVTSQAALPDSRRTKCPSKRSDFLGFLGFRV